MSYSFSSLVLCSILWLSFSSCDETLSPKDFDKQEPYVQSLSVNPNSISFDPQNDGQKDTTLTLSIKVDGFNFEDGSFPYYSVFIGDESFPSIQDFFKNSNAVNSFSSDIEISTNTIEFNSYTILVTPSPDGGNPNYARSVIRQTGVPINAPEILEVNNPEEVEIPSGSSSTVVLFTAKVVDVDGQQNIDRVLLNFRNADGTFLSENPFQMLDDGISTGGSSSGDETAADSVFTKSFTINSSNTPNNRTALYWAIDKSGLSSDTLQTTFNIVDNE